MARNGDGRTVPPRRSTNTQMSTLITTAICARKSLYPISARRDSGAGKSIDTSACEKASAVASAPNIQVPISIAAMSSVTIISVG